MGPSSSLLTDRWKSLAGCLPCTKLRGCPYSKDSFRDRPIDELAGGPIQGDQPLHRWTVSNASQKLFGMDVRLIGSKQQTTCIYVQGGEHGQRYGRTPMPWQDPAVDEPYFADPNQPAADWMGRRPCIWQPAVKNTRTTS